MLQANSDVVNVPAPGPLQPNQSLQLKMFDSELDLDEWWHFFISLEKTALNGENCPGLQNSRSFLDYDHFIGEAVRPFEGCCFQCDAKCKAKDHHHGFLLHL